jgi:hypothetical protein
VVTAHTATAAQENNTLESSMPMNIAGPLGIIVAAIGLTGLVLGLWRFLRKSAKARIEAATTATVEPEPALTPVRTTT